MVPGVIKNISRSSGTFTNGLENSYMTNTGHANIVENDHLMAC